MTVNLEVLLDKLFLKNLILICLLISTSSQTKKVLIIGGSGRVGGSAVRALFQQSYKNDGTQSLKLTVAGRSTNNWDSTASRLTNIVDRCKDESFRRHSISEAINFISLDIYSETELEKVIPFYDVIIHTAGPFQQLRDPTVLNAALKHGKLYLDVCDDIKLSEICRSEKYQSIARSNSGTAIISTGIWPGASSLLAQVLFFLRSITFILFRNYNF